MQTPLRALAGLARLLEQGGGDITLPQYRVLAMVCDGEDRASQLAHRLALAKSTITAVVDGLVDRDYLRRSADDLDKRATRITMTAAGRKALFRSESVMTKRLADVLARTAHPSTVERALAELGAALDGTSTAARRP